MFKKLDLSILCNCFKPQQQSDNVMLVETPHTFSDGDKINLLISKVGADTVCVSDGAATLMRTMYTVEVKSYFTKQQIHILEKAARDYGVTFDTKTGEFCVQVKMHEINRAAFNVISTATSASSFIYLMHALGAVAA